MNNITSEYGAEIVQLPDGFSEREQKLLHTSIKLQDFLSRNVGRSADWPIHLGARDEDSLKTLLQTLNNHSAAVGEYFVEPPVGKK